MGKINMTPNNKDDALTTALVLAICAPSEEKRQECRAVAEDIANSGMTLEQVAAAKARAQEILGITPRSAATTLSE